MSWVHIMYAVSVPSSFMCIYIYMYICIRTYMHCLRNCGTQTDLFLLETPIRATDMNKIVNKRPNHQEIADRLSGPGISVPCLMV
jgi:hypothetical protein